VVFAQEIPGESAPSGVTNNDLNLCQLLPE